MCLISRVNKSGMIAARRYIVSPVMQFLLILAAVLFIGIGIVGYNADGDVEQLCIILITACIIIGEYIGVPYVTALGRLECLQMFYDTKVLNFCVHFDDKAMLVTDLGGLTLGKIDYDEITKYAELKDSVVVISGFHVFIFNKAQAEKAGLREHLAERGVRVNKRK